MQITEQLIRKTFVISFFLVTQENELERLHFDEEFHQTTYLGCAIRISYFYLLPTGTYDQGKKYFILLTKGAAMEFYSLITLKALTCGQCAELVIS